MNIIQKGLNDMKRIFASPIVLLLMLAVFAVFTILLTGNAKAAEGDQVTLAWDANTETNLAGYRVYMDSEQAATIPLENLADPANPTFVYTLPDDSAHYFNVTAYAEIIVASGFSNTVFYADIKPPVNLVMKTEAGN